MDHAKKIGDAEHEYERATTARDEARSKLAAARANEAEAKAKVEIATTALASGSTGSAKTWRAYVETAEEMSARREACERAFVAAEASLESAGRTRAHAMAEQREAELAADRAEVFAIVDRIDARLAENESDLARAGEIFARRLAGAAFVPRSMFEPTPSGSYRSLNDLVALRRRDRDGLPTPHWSGSAIVEASEKQAQAQAGAFAAARAAVPELDLSPLSADERARLARVIFTIGAARAAEAMEISPAPAAFQLKALAGDEKAAPTSSAEQVIALRGGALDALPGYVRRGLARAEAVAGLGPMPQGAPAPSPGPTRIPSGAFVGGAR